MNQILFILIYIIAILSLLYALWMMIPVFYGLPWVPTAKDRVRKALKMAELCPDELLYDLGAGDGRILFMAEEEFGARAVGIEASFLQYLFIKARIFFGGKQAKIHARRENFYRSDIRDADVVFAYLTSEQAIHLQDNLAKQLKLGARVIAVSADFPDWKPIAFDEGYLLFLYEMPPQKGGMMAYFAERDKDVDLPYLDIS